MRYHWGIFVALVIGVLIADQASKALVIQHLVLYESLTPIPALSDFFRITHSYNSGAAFGIFPQASNLFLVLSIVIVIGLTVYYAKLPPIAIYSRIGIGLVVGGALGNLVDRIQHGHVTDFIHYTIGGISNISNIADHAVVIGIIIIILDTLRLEYIEKQNSSPDQENNNSDF
jgi:signal peptidase II